MEFAVLCLQQTEFQQVLFNTKYQNGCLMPSEMKSRELVI